VAIETGVSVPEGFEAQRADAACVVFMFTVANRIASGLGVAPEWSWLRRGEWVRRLTRPLMARLGQLLMSLSSEEPGPCAPLETDLRTLLHAIGYTQCDAICRMLGHHPRLATVVFQIVSASLSESELDASLGQSIAQACLRNHQGAPPETGVGDAAHGSSSAIGASENAECVAVSCRFAERLFARPYTLSPQDLSELRRCGLDEGRVVDSVFRIAILAGISRLEAEPLFGLISASVR
jgi:hypothetical protein